MNYVTVKVKSKFLGYYLNFDLENLTNEKNTDMLRAKFIEVLNNNEPSIKKDCRSSYLIRTSDTIKVVHRSLLKLIKEISKNYSIDNNSYNLKLSILKIKNKNYLMSNNDTIDCWIKSIPIPMNTIKTD